MAALLSALTTFAFTSRFTLIFIQILCNNLIPDHDANVFNPPLHQENFTVLDSIVQFCFGGLRRWDAIYFTHIAEYGYTYENCVAFFPFYPLIVYLSSRVVSVFVILQMSQSVLFTGILINCTLFSLTSRNLYSLGIESGLEAVPSLFSVFVFCINPASIFMTAPYSETLYFYLLTLSLLYIRRGLVFRASLIIAISISVRSNGLVGVGFVLFSIAQNFIDEFYNEKKGKLCFSLNKNFIFSILRNFVKIILCLVICLSTFFLYQYYIYKQFCINSPNSAKVLNSEVIAYGREHGYKIVGDPPSSWCFQKLPISYSYVQAKHWGVGFLNYYQVKQIPNFLLAFPVVYMSLCSCMFFFKLNPQVFLTLGLIRSDIKSKKRSDETLKDQDLKRCGDEKCLLAEKMAVYVFHLAFLTLFGCCFIHIQVLTRLLFSSSPLLYWYAGLILYKNPQLSSYVRSLIAATTKTSKATTTTNQKVLGKIRARENLPAKKWKCDSSKSNGCKLFSIYRKNYFYNYFCEGSIMQNIGVKVLVFFMTNWASLSRQSKFILLYCIGYVFTGTVLFSNFLPWT